MCLLAVIVSITKSYLYKYKIGGGYIPKKYI